ncbi:MAG: bifunctional DedA family/phosphatase PAP2 family protein [Burkholderiaceae bacterium]
MNEWLTSVVDLFAQNPPLAYLVVFLVAMGEALLIIGLFVPSTVVLVGAGTLVGLGSLPAVPVILATLLGAVVGDQLSYLAGRHGQHRIRGSWLMHKYAPLFAQGEAFVTRHGGKSVFIGRFVPGVKAVIPAIAGMAGMKPVRFTAVNVLSSIAWTAAHLLPAFALGRGISVAHAGNPRLLILSAILLVTGLLAWVLVRVARSRLLPLAERGRDRLLVWLGLHRRPEPHWLERLLRNHNDLLRLTAYAMVALAAGTGFALLAVKLMIDPVLAQADLAISNGLRGLQTADVTEVMVGLTMLGDGAVLLPLALALVIGLWLGRERRLALSIALAFGGAALFVPFIKASLQRSRPTELYLGAEAFSFPSGHATLTTTIVGITVLVLAHPLAPARRRIAYGCAALLVMLIAFAGLLQAHWPTDVAAGLLVGGMLVFILAVLLHDRAVSASLQVLAAIVGITFAAAAILASGGTVRTRTQALPGPRRRPPRSSEPVWSRQRLAIRNLARPRCWPGDGANRSPCKPTCGEDGAREPRCRRLAGLTRPLARRTGQRGAAFAPAAGRPAGIA